MADDLGWRGRAARPRPARPALVGLVQLRLAGQPGARRRGRRPGGVIVAMAAMFLVALAIPEAWGDEGGGISAPVVLAVAWRSVRLRPPGRVRRGGGRRRRPAPAAAPHGGPGRRRRSALLVAGAVLGGADADGRSGRWRWSSTTSASTSSGTDWRLPAPAALRRAARPDRDHRAGGVDHRRRRRGRRPAAHRADRSWRRCSAWRSAWRCGGLTSTWSPRWPSGCSRHGRAPSGCGWPATLHLPALPDDRRGHLPGPGTEEGRRVRRRHRRTTRSPTRCRRPPLWALYGGVAVYLLAHLGFRLRNVGSINRPRAVVAVVLLVAPLRSARPAGAGRARRARRASSVALIAFEVVRYAEARAAVRAEAAPPLTGRVQPRPSSRRSLATCPVALTL